MDLQEFSKHLEGHRRDSTESLDGQLVDDCIRLLAQLESQVDRLPASNGMSGVMHLALETAKEMLVIAIDFVTQRFGQESVARDLHRVCELRDSARDLQQMLKRSFWQSLFARNSIDDPLAQHAYRQLGNDFAEVFASILSHVDPHYANAASVPEWRASCAIMIEEFRQRW